MALNPDDEEKLRPLVHELAEALAAARAHLLASQGQNASEIREAISKALEQTDRAVAVVARLRFTISGV